VLISIILRFAVSCEGLCLRAAYAAVEASSKLYRAIIIVPLCFIEALYVPLKVNSEIPVDPGILLRHKTIGQVGALTAFASLISFLPLGNLV